MNRVSLSDNAKTSPCLCFRFIFSVQNMRYIIFYSAAHHSFAANFPAVEGVIKAFALSARKGKESTSL